MKKIITNISILAGVFFMLLSGCGRQEKGEFKPNISLPSLQVTQPSGSMPLDFRGDVEKTPLPTPTPPDYKALKVNEVGQIPIVMFHSFVEDYSGISDNDYTATFSYFRNLLEDLYNRGYRLISMRDFIDSKISVPAGTIPIIFTFDDATPGQFSLIKENGKLKLNPKTAVGILKEFNKKHPDFGMKGIFYINGANGDGIFKGEGTISERLKYLINMGFEVGNHTWSHAHLSEVSSKEAIEEQLGKNQEAVNRWLDRRYMMYSLALPFGQKPTKELEQYLSKGEYKGTKYRNQTIMAVGASPAIPVFHRDYDPLYVRRIRAQGKITVNYDLTWWLDRMTRKRMYVSDGNPDTVVVPADKRKYVNEERLKGKRLVVYR